jgi:hypothetical protein
MDLNEFKMKKQRGLTPKEILKEVSNADMTDVIVVYKDKEGMIAYGYSADNKVEGIGMLEVVKNELLNDMEM